MSSRGSAREPWSLPMRSHYKHIEGTTVAGHSRCAAPAWLLGGQRSSPLYSSTLSSSRGRFKREQLLSPPMRNVIRLHSGDHNVSWNVIMFQREVGAWNAAWGLGVTTIVVVVHGGGHWWDPDSWDNSWRYTHYGLYGVGVSPPTLPVNN